MSESADVEKMFAIGLEQIYPPITPQCDPKGPAAESKMRQHFKIGNSREHTRNGDGASSNHANDGVLSCEKLIRPSKSLPFFMGST